MRGKHQTGFARCPKAADRPRRSRENPNPLSTPPSASPTPPNSDPLVSIVVPIYNEERLLEEVLRRVRALPIRKQLILVDDCSRDRTPEILEKEKAHADTVVLRHDRNQGKGAAIRTGLTRATGEIVLIQDADLEYNPEELPPLIAPIAEGRAGVVYGSRFLGEVRKMRLQNRVANWLLAWLVSILYGQRITDEATAYKVFRGDIIRAIDLKCNRYEFCPEVTAKVLKRGEKILELPVTFTARTVEEGKKIGWKDFFEAVWTLLRYRF
ncbi:glycosyltransferase family 2 protein [Candidatus Sumerlaeota bacterium]|nr:glycosyltransferase family 2 protein [Candidatus Sumerlaeota bacterium]